MPSIERLIVATSPFQELIMTTRRVYRWEYPAETVKYLAIYLLLWYLNLLLPGVVSLFMVNSSNEYGNNSLLAFRNSLFGRRATYPRQHSRGSPQGHYT
jgi:hypothetical protein